MSPPVNVPRQRHAQEGQPSRRELLDLVDGRRPLRSPETLCRSLFALPACHPCRGQVLSELTSMQHPSGESVAARLCQGQSATLGKAGADRPAASAASCGHLHPPAPGSPFPALPGALVPVRRALHRPRLDGATPRCERCVCRERLHPPQNVKRRPDRVVRSGSLRWLRGRLEFRSMHARGDGVAATTNGAGRLACSPALLGGASARDSERCRMVRKV